MHESSTVRARLHSACRCVSAADRGTIRVGAAADLALLNPDTVADRATLKDPSQLSVGIERVWVNGQPVWRQGKTIAAHPGTLIKRAASAKPFTCARATH